MLSEFLVKKFKELRIKGLFLQTVDQFFALKVPMRSSELSSLCRGIDNAFQVYAKLVVNQLGKSSILNL